MNFRRFLEQEKLSKFFMKKCGFISIIGKTNVGKSTFLNNFIGKKISITSKTVQTTRSNIFAVETRGKNQMVFIDTPGVHGNINKTVNKYLRKKTLENLLDIDVIIFMISGSMFTQVDQKALNLIKESKAKKLFVMNKIDLVKNKGDLFKFVDDFEHKDVFEAFLPISAEKIDGFQAVEEEVIKALPNSDFLFPEEGYKFQTINFEITEIIREKVIRNLGDELPHETAVHVERVDHKKDILEIEAEIFVSKEGQKKIVIGSNGEKIKIIGTSARRELEQKFASKVFLKLWCRVKKNWIDNQNYLESLGIKN